MRRAPGSSWEARRITRWAIAFKFEPRKEVTRIDRIFVSVGRTGVLTPVRLLRPVEVGGVTVSRATLHNREELERKDVREGDLVRVQRAGDVIPQVVERIDEEGRDREASFAMPAACPSCGTRPVQKGPFTVCPNHFACRAQLRGRITHFGSRSALDIEGLGAETAALLVDEGLVKELADLFDLREADLVPLEGSPNSSRATWSERSASAVVSSCRGSWWAWGFPRWEWRLPPIWLPTSVDRGDPRGDAEAMEEIHGVGPKMSAAIRRFLDEPEVSGAVDRLIAKGLEFEVPEPLRARTGDLADKTVVITGTLAALSRSGLKKKLIELGARVTGSVSARTDFLLVGANPGSKVKRHGTLGVQLLTEDQFLERFGGMFRDPDDGPVAAGDR